MNLSSNPVNFPFPIPNWIRWMFFGFVLWPATTAAIRAANNGIDWPTQTWLIICFVLFAIGTFAGCLIWFIIPGRIKNVLDNFTVRLSGRMTTLEGAIATRLEQLTEELTQLLEKQDEEESDRAQVLLAFTSSIMVDRVITDEGFCQICKHKIEGWEDTPEGDPSHFLHATHGWLGPGKKCPVPTTYQLVHGNRPKSSNLLPASHANKT